MFGSLFPAKFPRSMLGDVETYQFEKLPIPRAMAQIQATHGDRSCPPWPVGLWGGTPSKWPAPGPSQSLQVEEGNPYKWDIGRW